MNESLVELWNETVAPNDTVIYLGDFSMNHHVGAKYAKRLNGRKTCFTAGNHDKAWKGQEQWIKFYQEEFGFENIHPRGVFPRVVLRWDNGVDFTSIHVRLSHLPYEVFDGRYQQYLPPEDGSGIDFLAHGHRHSDPDSKVRISKKGNIMVDCGVDGNDYKPVSEAQLLEMYFRASMKQRGLDYDKDFPHD